MGDDDPINPEVPDEGISQGHAHEMLTPLTVVRGYVQLARRYLSHRDGPKISQALASLDIADSHVAHLANAVRRRAMKPHQSEETAPE